jgi:hypothetical protein
MMGRIAAERPHIRFVENNAEQVVTNPARIAERKLDNVYFCAAPFYDQQDESFGDQHAHPFPQMRQRHLSLKPVIQPTREDAANSHQASAFAKAFS